VGRSLIAQGPEHLILVVHRVYTGQVAIAAVEWDEVGSLQEQHTALELVPEGREARVGLNTVILCHYSLIRDAVKRIPLTVDLPAIRKSLLGIDTVLATERRPTSISAAVCSS